MKILSFIKGEAKVKIESKDDLWHIARLIEPEDIVAGQIVRKVRISTEDERARLKREQYFVKLKAEKIEFETSGVKVLGSIIAGPEELPIGSYHTLDIRCGDVITIIKQWKEYQIKRLRDAEKQTQLFAVGVCVLDDEVGTLAEFSSTGIKYIAQIPLGLAKKRYVQKAEEQFGKLVSAVLDLAKNYNVIIIASPLFWKEELFKKLKEKNPEIEKKIRLETISTGGKRGVLELLKRGALDKIVRGNLLQKEMQLVEAFLIELAKEGLAVYKFEDVLKAAQFGAIKTLLVTEKAISDFRQRGAYQDLSKLFDMVEATRGEIHIISSQFEAGERLDGLGGIGAILRFRI
ncbi:MAG: mRNA surveillance protein pelota [Candidatus Nanoarchaeia archaeon]